MDFLQTCQHRNVVPKFLRVKLANRNLRSSSAYKTCQKRLLKEEINIKKNKIKQHLLERNSVKKQLQFEISFFDFSQVCALFLNIDNKKLNRSKSIQNKKFSNLLSENPNLVSARSHDPEKVSFNFSSHDLSDDEKLLLCKSLNFSIPFQFLERLALNNLSNNKNISFKNLTRATVLLFLTKTNTLKECPKC